MRCVRVEDSSFMLSVIPFEVIAAIYNIFFKHGLHNFQKYYWPLIVPLNIA